MRHTPERLRLRLDGKTSTQTKLGGLVDPNETCTPYSSSNFDRSSGFFNAYVDLGNWAGLTPYIGGGVGVSYVQTSAAVNYFKNSDGSVYAPDLSAGMDGYQLLWYSKAGGPYDSQGYPLPLNPQPNIPFAPINWNHTVNKKSWKFAWNLMAGFSYDLYQNLKLDLGYRFLDAGSYTSLAGHLGAPPVTRELITHEVRLGLRMTAD